MKTFGIIGAVCFALAVAVGYFCNFNGDALVQVALSSFGLASLIIGDVKKAKAEGNFNWKFITSLALAVVGGVICAIGGVANSIFATIAGAVVALLAIVFGLITVKK